jgi:hypothetical protein
MALRDLTPQELSEFAGQNDPSLVEVDAPNNTVFDEKNNRVLSLPQTLNADETQFIIDRDIDGKKQFFAQQPIEGIGLPPAGGMSGGRAYAAAYEALGDKIDESARGMVAAVLRAPEYWGSNKLQRGEALMSGRTRMFQIPANSTAGMFDSPMGTPETDLEETVRKSVGESLAQDGVKLIERNRRYMAESGWAKREGDGIMYDIGQGGASLVASLGLTALFRSPSAAAIMFGAMQNSQIYLEARESGADPDTAAAVALPAGIVEAALEKVGLDRFMKALRGNTAVKRFVSGAVIEGIQEGSQQLAESGITNAAGVRNQDATEIGQDVLYSAFLGSVIGGPANAVIGAFVKEEAVSKGLSEDQAEALSKYAVENIDSAKQDMGEFIDKEVAPLAADDKSAREFMTLMQKFDNRVDVVDPNALSPEERAVFDEYVEYFNNATRDETGVRGVETDFFNKMTAAGVDQDQAVAASKLMGMRADAAARAAGVSPKEWYNSLNLRVEVQRTPEEAKSVYQEKLDEMRRADLAIVQNSLDQARASDLAPAGPKKPIISYLRKRGGVNVDSTLAGELRNMGLNSKMAPGLFTKKKGAGDIDNIPASEFNAKFGVTAKEDGNGYVDRNWLLEQIDSEMRGRPVGKQAVERDEGFLRALEEAGLDVNTATAEQVYEALGPEGDVIAQARVMGEEINPQQAREILGIQADNRLSSIEDAIERWQEREAIKLFQKAPNTQSAAFKKWFGDSKVVDAEGNPQVVYHGTGAQVDEQFIFDYSRIGSQGRSEGAGFYFTDDQVVAQGYATAGGGSVIEAYMSIKKPMAYDQKPFSKAVIKKIVKKLADIEAKENGMSIRDGFLSNFGDVQYDGIDNVLNEAANLIAEDATALDQISGMVGSGAQVEHVNKAVQAVTGHDGVIAKGFGNQGDRGGNIYVAFFPQQIKSVNNRGTFDQNDARVLYQSSTKNGFYSALQAQIESLQQPKGSPEQWAGIIKNLTQKGVKQEEIDWTGVLNWLAEQKGSVTKDQVLGYLQANEIKVEEVVKGDDTEKKAIIEELAPYGYDAEDMGRLSTSALRTAGVPDDLIERFDQAFITSDETKFEKYTLPGGTNYRELLMKLPDRSVEILSFDEWLDAKGYDLDNGDIADLRAQYDNDVYKLGDTAYRSSHYDEKNILAHIRFNERTDADGKRVMFIEEVQSDWHQAGREKGYKNDNAIVPINLKYAELDKKVRALNEQQNQLMSEETSKLNAGENYDDVRSEYSKKIAAVGKDIANLQREQQILREQMNVAISGVPDAPFKTSWPELAFKRALMWAVDNNFDRVAWTTGEQQAERYDLSKQVQRVVIGKNDKGYWLAAWKDAPGEDTQADIEKTGLSDRDLADQIGRELAEKALKDLNGKNGQRSYTGVDLKVGGEGMKAFYDKMLPSMVNKLVKKWGGKVGTTKLEAGTFTKADDELLAELNDTTSTQEGDQPISKGVWALDITPAMRDSIKQGLPLFQDNRGSITFGPDSTIIQLFEGADPSTLLHEMGHLFLRDMRGIAAQSKRPMVARDYKIVKEWLGAKGDTFTVDQEEKFARGFEAYLREGKSPKPELQGIFDRFKEWLTQIYKSVRDLDVKINDDIRQVFDRMLGGDFARTEAQILARDAAKVAADYQKIAAPSSSTFGGDASNVIAGAGQLASNIFTPVSARLGRIDPKLKAAVRKFTFETGLNQQRDRSRALPFLNAMENMSEEDYRIFDFALKNRDEAKVKELVDKYKMGDAYGQVQEMLDEIYASATETGMDLGYLQAYFPRMVRMASSTEYLNTLRGTAQWSAIEEAIVAEDPNGLWTDEEKAVFANKLLRGFPPGITNAKKPSFTKERKIDYVEPEHNQFYLPSGEALLQYINSMRLGIAQREIFGKGLKSEESIGAYVASMIKQGVINHEQEAEVKDVMNALINSKGPGVFVSWVKNAGYVYLMGSPISAMTQIQDLGWSLAKNGYYRTAVSFVKSVTNNQMISKEELGIDNIAREFEDETRAAKAVRVVFKAIGLEWMDNVGKEVFIESSYKRLQSSAKKNAPAFQQKLVDIFGEEAKQVRADLLDGTLSDNVKELLYSELSDFQPISLAEMPTAYLRGGNWRSLYMLKTYTVKQIDIYRREIFDKMAHPIENPALAIEGTQMLVRLAIALMLMGMASDALKDLILGRPIELSDLVVDNMLKTAGITKYQIYQSKQDGLANTMMQYMFVPPLYAPVDNAVKDVSAMIGKENKRTGEYTRMKPKDAQSLSYVPVVGKFYYWWYGGGKTKLEKQKQKD